MKDRSEHLAWLREALGVELADMGPRQPVLPIWTEAQRTAEAALDRLGDTLRGIGHPDFDRVAGAGLTQIRKQLNPGPAQVLAALDNASGAAWAMQAKKARKVMAKLHSRLAAHPALPILDANPLGVTPALTPTLTTAIANIQARLAGKIA